MESQQELNHGKGRNMELQVHLEPRTWGFLGLSHCFSPLLLSARWLHSFSFHTSWFHVAGHMAADNSCVLHFVASTVERDFLSFSIQKILSKDSVWPILAQDQWPRVWGHLRQYYTIVRSTYRNMEKKQNESITQYQLCTFKTHTKTILYIIQRYTYILGHTSNTLEWLPKRGGKETEWELGWREKR